MSVDFPPTRVGRRRVGFDPLVPAIAVVVAVIGIAVAKPWASDDPRPERPTASLAPAAVVPPAVVASAHVPSPAVTVPSDARIALAARPHDAWGIRAVVQRPAGLVEIWAPATGGTGSGHVTAALLPDASIVALGVTSPSTANVAAVRIWREWSNDLSWLNAQPLLDAKDIAGLFAPPTDRRSGGAGWAPGAYRFDLLVDGSIQRIGAAIPNAQGNVPGRGSSARRWIWSRPPRRIHRSFGRGCSRPRTASAWRSVAGMALSEAAAWSATVVPDGILAPHVAVATVPRATGLGVMLTERAQVQEASLERLVPGPLVVPALPVGGVSSMRGQVPYVAFELAEGGALEPGVYALFIDWSDDRGRHSGTWHVELRPTD